MENVIVQVLSLVNGYSGLIAILSLLISGTLLCFHYQRAYREWKNGELDRIVDTIRWKNQEVERIKKQIQLMSLLFENLFTMFGKAKSTIYPHQNMNVVERQNIIRNRMRGVQIPEDTIEATQLVQRIIYWRQKAEAHLPSFWQWFFKRKIDEGTIEKILNLPL